MIYKGIVKNHSLKRRIAILLVSGLLLYYEITQKQYFYIPFTVLLILATFHHKEHIVSEKGIDIKYTICGISSTNRWTWDQITAVQPDYIKARPNAKLLFEKDSVLRSFLFTPEDCQAIVKMAAKMNPEAFIDDYTAEEQEAMEEEKRKQQEKLRAQRVQAKKAKKKRK